MHQLKSPAELNPQSRFVLQDVEHHEPLQVPSLQSELDVHGSPMPAAAWQYWDGAHTLPPFSRPAQQLLVHSELELHESAHSDPEPVSTQ